MREDDLIRLITEEVVKELNQCDGMVPVALSNRHIHLSRQHVDKLFGAGYQLTKLKDLSQPGQFAAKETVRLIGPKGVLEDVRILGPARGETQVELALSDGYRLGVIPPIRPSGNLKETPGCVVAGPKGVVELEYGVIAALRHIHMSTEDGQRFGIDDQQIVKVRCLGPRTLIFDQVLVRVNSNFHLEMHLDLEEGNAAGLKNGDLVQIIKEG